MVRAIGDENWSKAYVTTDLLPSFKEFAEATKAAFGTKIAGTEPTEQRFNIFNGTTMAVQTTSTSMQTLASLRSQTQALPRIRKATL